MGDVALALLSGGVLEADRALVHPGDDTHRRIGLPISQVVVRSGDRTILLDTGLPPEVAGDSGALQRILDIDPAWCRAETAPEERVDRQLALLDLRPADLHLVINTHFHFDHACGNALFAGGTIAAQEAEFVAAQGNDDYPPLWDAPGVEFRAVHGDWSPLPGVDLLHTPGHTPGHQSMLVHLESGPWLFTFDAVYTEEHWRTGKLGVVNDVAAARASVARLHDLAASTQARVVFGHDIAQWDALQHAPYWYR